MDTLCPPVRSNYLHAKGVDREEGIERGVCMYLISELVSNGSPKELMYNEAKLRFLSDKAET